MKRPSNILQSIVYVLLLTTALATLLAFIAFVLFFGIELTLYKNGTDPIYGWNITACFIALIGILVFLYRKRYSITMELISNDGMFVWDIACTILGVTLLIFFALAFVSSVTLYLKRDRDPRVSSLNELLEKSSQLQGQTITMSPEAFDTAAVYKDMQELAKNEEFKWKRFTSKEERFSIDFPNFDIIEKQQLLPGDKESYKANTYSANMDNKVDYNRGYSVYCVKLSHGVSINYFFSEQQNELLLKERGKLIKEEEENGPGYIGKRMDIEMGDKDGWLRVKIIYYKGRVYIIKVYSDYSKANNEATNNFFNSFKLY